MIAIICQPARGQPVELFSISAKRKIQFHTFYIDKYLKTAEHRTVL